MPVSLGAARMFSPGANGPATAGAPVNGPTLAASIRWRIMGRRRRRPRATRRRAVRARRGNRPRASAASSRRALAASAWASASEMAAAVAADRRRRGLAGGEEFDLAQVAEHLAEDRVLAFEGKEFARRKAPGGCGPRPGNGTPRENARASHSFACEQGRGPAAPLSRTRQTAPDNASPREAAWDSRTARAASHSPNSYSQQAQCRPATGSGTTRGGAPGPSISTYATRPAASWSKASGSGVPGMTRRPAS